MNPENMSKEELTAFQKANGLVVSNGHLSPQTKSFIKKNGVFTRPDSNPTASPVTTSNTPNSPLPPTQTLTEQITGGMTTPTTGMPAGQADIFNNLMVETLKKAQGLGTADLLQKKRELQRMQLSRAGQEFTGEDAFMSPGSKNAIRSGDAKALDPLIDENAYQIEKAQQAIDNFYKITEEARKFGSEFADKLIAPDSVIANAKMIIEQNPSMASTILAGFNDKTKEKIIGSLDYASIKKSTSAGNSNQTSDNERALLSSFQSSPIVKDYNVIVSQKLTFDNFVNNGIGGPADLAMVFSFMKGLDPNSVVRESEYDTAAKSGNIFAGAFAKFNGYFKANGGFLPASVKAEFQNLVNQRLQAQKAQYDNFASEYRSIAERQGLNPDNVVINFSGALPTSAQGKTVTITDPKTGRVIKGNYSEAQIKAAEGQGLKVSFNQGGSGTTNSSDLTVAIASQESGNNYNPPPSPAGALGKYQILPKTLKGLGYNVTDEEFLSNPKLQDEAHGKLIAELTSRHKGNIDKILADYYGGPNAAKKVGTPAGDVPQESGGKKFPSINQYVAQVKSRLNLA